MNRNILILILATLLIPIQIHPEDLGKIVVIKTDPPVSRFVNARAGLNLREKPEQGAKKITTLPYRTGVQLIAEHEKLITIDGVEGRWTKVKAGDAYGWVFGGYLSADMPPRCLNPNELVIMKTFYLESPGPRWPPRLGRFDFSKNFTGTLTLWVERRGEANTYHTPVQWKRSGNDVMVTVKKYGSAIEEALNRNVGMGGPGTCFGACFSAGESLSAEEQNACALCTKNQENDYGKKETELDISILLRDTPGGVLAEYSQSDLREIPGKKPWPAAIPLVSIGENRAALKWGCFSAEE